MNDCQYIADTHFALLHFHFQRIEVHFVDELLHHISVGEQKMSSDSLGRGGGGGSIQWQACN